jgi:speckle-type POZ protein
LGLGLCLAINASCGKNASYKIWTLGPDRDKRNEREVAIKWYIPGGVAGAEVKYPMSLFMSDVNRPLELGLDETLTLYAEVTVTNEIISSLVTPTLHSDQDMETKSLLNDLKALYETRVGADVRIFAGNSEEPVLVHSALLVARSPVFRAMLCHSMKEGVDKEIRIEDMDTEVLRQLVRFLYMDSTGDLRRTAVPILLAADKYDIKKLQLICENYLINHLTDDSLDQVLNLSRLLGSNKLKNAAGNFMFSM